MYDNVCMYDNAKNKKYLKVNNWFTSFRFLLYTIIHFIYYWAGTFIVEIYKRRG